nr:hypothetical protein [uncultured Oscillibacter sp.]
MTEKQKTILLWIVIAILLPVQLLLTERQGGDAGKMAGRILCLALFIYNLSNTRKLLR